MPTICCLHRCTNIEELYLEKADSPAITTYLLAHILKFLNQLKVLALPKQCDDDVASCVGINCPKLESIVLTGTNVSNVGLSWLVCCRQLHSVIIPGFFQGITPKGVVSKLIFFFKFVRNKNNFKFAGIKLRRIIRKLFLGTIAKWSARFATCSV